MLKGLDLKRWKRFALALSCDYNLIYKYRFLSCPEE